MTDALTKEKRSISLDCIGNRIPSNEKFWADDVDLAVEMLKEKIQKVTIYTGTNNQGLYKPDVEKLIDECFPAFKEEKGDE